MTTEYIIVQRPAQCSEMGCQRYAVAGSRKLPMFRWCLSHFVEQVQLQERHRVQSEGREDEVALLVATLHDVYHLLDSYEDERDEQIAATKRLIEEHAKRLPECSELPTLREVAGQRLA